MDVNVCNHTIILNLEHVTKSLFQISTTNNKKIKEITQNDFLKN